MKGVFHVLKPYFLMPDHKSSLHLKRFNYLYTNVQRMKQLRKYT